MTQLNKTRPEFRNINALHGSHHLPTASSWLGVHPAPYQRHSMMFLLMPFIVWMFDSHPCRSEISYDSFTSAFTAGLGFVPGWFVKLVALALIWAYLHHLIAGVRHLYMDATHSVTKEFGASSAYVVLALSIGLTVILGAKLFGLY
jgi:succinate dehydrogenase / fumarate reductase cytochrome b subunit